MSEPHVIAQRGASLLIGVDDETARILDTRHLRLFPPQSIASALARGYWNEFAGSTAEVAGLLAEATEVYGATEAPNLMAGEMHGLGAPFAPPRWRVRG